MYFIVRHFVFQNAPAQAQKAHAPLRHGARAQKRTNPGDKAYRDGLYTKAWSGTDIAERRIGSERKATTSDGPAIGLTPGNLLKPKFKATKSKIQWNKKKK